MKRKMKMKMAEEISPSHSLLYSLGILTFPIDRIRWRRGRKRGVKKKGEK